MGIRSATRRGDRRAWQPGMGSEWEVCFLGLTREFLSVLEEAHSPVLLRWTYDGLVGGWDQCVIGQHGQSALAVFQTELSATEPYLKKLMQAWPAREAVTTHLKRCLASLGRMVSEDDSQVRVGPATTVGPRSASHSHMPNVRVKSRIFCKFLQAQSFL
jgi:hypothetical protein